MGVLSPKDHPLTPNVAILATSIDKTSDLVTCSALKLSASFRLELTSSATVEINYGPHCHETSFLLFFKIFKDRHIDQLTDPPTDRYHHVLRRIPSYE